MPVYAEILLGRRYEPALSADVDCFAVFVDGAVRISTSANDHEVTENCCTVACDYAARFREWGISAASIVNSQRAGGLYRRTGPDTWTLERLPCKPLPPEGVDAFRKTLAQYGVGEI